MKTANIQAVKIPKHGEREQFQVKTEFTDQEAREILDEVIQKIRLTVRGSSTHKASIPKEAEGREFHFEFKFVEPAQHLIEFAKQNTDSSNEDLRAVAKAVVDVLAESQKIRHALGADVDTDLAPFFDF